MHDSLLQACLAARPDPELEPFVRFVSRPASGWVARAAALLSTDRAHAARIDRRARAVALSVVERLAPERLPASVRRPGPPSTAAARVVHGLELVRIPAGEFWMGSEAGDARGFDDERPRHLVKIARPFQLARTPVTNAQYRAFVEATGHVRPESWKERRFNADDQPVVGVSWDDAQAFCAWAGLRLPSEAEWEYACRGLVRSERVGMRYWSGNGEQDLARVGWYDANSGSRTHAVGEKPANPFGLCDMHGNVWEWCQDRWHTNYDGAPADGSAWEEGGSGRRVLRGGAWLGTAWGCRSACRRGGRAGVRLGDAGFRPASSSPD